MAIERPFLKLDSDEAFWQWIAEHHATSEGVRLVVARKGSGLPSPSIDQALRACLCYGWIDGQRKRIDDKTYSQVYVPRTKRSTWSVRNIGLVDELIAEGKMMPAGYAEIERAKADGRWDAAYEGPANMTIPDDFLNAIAEDPILQSRFDALKQMQKYHIYFQLFHAKKPETRQRRFDKLIGYLRGDAFPER